MPPDDPPRPPQSLRLVICASIPYSEMRSRRPDTEQKGGPRSAQHRVSPGHTRGAPTSSAPVGAPLRSIKETFRTAEARSSSSRSPSNHFQGMFFLRRTLHVSPVSRQDCGPCHSHASYPSAAQTAPLRHSVLRTALPFAAAASARPLTPAPTHL